MNEVSLYIPCFNAAKTIQFCLEAVFRQTYPLKEIIIVDDGSTDETIDIVSRYPVRLLRHPDNRGLAEARNTAIRNIDSEFIASLDADCLPDSDWLKQLMKRFNSPTITGAGGRLLETYSSSVFDLWRSVHMKQYWDKEGEPAFLFGSNTVFRKDVIVAVGLYNEDFKNNYEDVDICSRLKDKGYVLIYEPRAIAHHLRNDDICSILNSYWKWNLGYYQEKRYYSNQKSFIFKIKDNFGLAYRYIAEDIASQRFQLLHLDFLLALHHSQKDFDYFILQNKQKDFNILEYSLWSFWLALLDLTFFHHFEPKENNIPTLMSRENIPLQNLLALNLLLDRTIQSKFKDNKFKKILYKHLYLSIYKINNTYLLDKLLNLVELHQDWSGLFRKKQPNLNAVFLKTLSSGFQKWLEDLEYVYPGIIQMIIISADKIDALAHF